MKNKIKSIIKEAIYDGLDEMYGFNREADPYFSTQMVRGWNIGGESKEDVDFTLLCYYVHKNDEYDGFEREFTISIPMQVEYEYDEPDCNYPIDMGYGDVIQYALDKHLIPNNIGDYVLDHPLDTTEIIDTYPEISWD